MTRVEPHHVACSWRCRRRIHKDNLNRATRKPKQVTHCRVCGEVLDARRSDASYCSAKCKQKAWRDAARYR
jgi:hypothetical protein